MTLYKFCCSLDDKVYLISTYLEVEYVTGSCLVSNYKGTKGILIEYNIKFGITNKYQLEDARIKFIDDHLIFHNDEIIYVLDGSTTKIIQYDDKYSNIIGIYNGQLIMDCYIESINLDNNERIKGKIPHRGLFSISPNKKYVLNCDTSGITGVTQLTGNIFRDIFPPNNYQRPCCIYKWILGCQLIEINMSMKNINFYNEHYYFIKCINISILNVIRPENIFVGDNGHIYIWNHKHIAIIDPLDVVTQINNNFNIKMYNQQYDIFINNEMNTYKLINNELVEHKFTYDITHYIPRHFGFIIDMLFDFFPDLIVNDIYGCLAKIYCNEARHSIIKNIENIIPDDESFFTSELSWSDIEDDGGAPDPDLFDY